MRQLRVVLAVVVPAAAIAFVAQALATPGSNASSVFPARGPVSQEVVIGTPRTATATRTVRVRVAGRTVRRRVRFTYQTVTPLMRCGASSPCDTLYQQLTIQPGGHTGWHTHPGPTFVAIASGVGTLYHGVSGCPSTRYAAGAGFMQPTTEVHNMRNEGTEPLVLYAFYALPAGTTNPGSRVDQPQPAACPNIP